MAWTRIILNGAYCESGRGGFTAIKIVHAEKVFGIRLSKSREQTSKCTQSIGVCVRVIP